MECSTDWRSFFLANVPSLFLQELLQRAVFPAYKEASQVCFDGYSAESAHDLLAHMQRAKLEDNLHALGLRHQLPTRYARNSTKNAFHVEVTCGQVIVTASALDNPKAMVRWAEFRQTIARSCQTSFEGWLKDEPPPADGYLYALLIHGRSDDQVLPAFVDVVFPSPDFTAYLARIELYKMFRNLPELKVFEDLPGQADTRLRTEEGSAEG